MLVVMQQGATEEQIEHVIDRLVDLGFDVHRSTGVIHTVLGGVGGKDDFDLAVFEVMEGVKEAHRIVSPYKLASRSFRPGGTVVKVGDVEIGGDRVVVMAGPCSVENREQIEQCGRNVAARTARRSSAAARSSRAVRRMSFRGWAKRACKCCATAADRHGLLVVSEVMDQTQIPLLAEYADILQVGARNMQNFNLLRELGKQRKPVLLKRGIAATIEELLLSAEYILAGGNYNVILCERGIRTFETYTRNTHGYLRHPGGEEAVAPADCGRPVARHGTARQGGADGARGGGGGRRWTADRSASRPRPRAQRRRAIAAARAVRGTDASVAEPSRRRWARTICKHAKRRHRRHGLDRRVFGLALRKAGFDGRDHRASVRRAPSRMRVAAGAIDRGAPLAEAVPRGGPDFSLADHRPHSRYHPSSGSAAATRARWSPMPAAPSARSSIWRVQQITRGQFLGGHPMAGKETRGASAADADLFRGRTWVLTPDEPAELHTPAAARIPQVAGAHRRARADARCRRA